MKFIKINIGLIYLLLSIFWPADAQSQIKTNIVTKEINETFKISSKQEIIINAEKADIKIIESKNNEFVLKLKLISKNTNIKVAKEQLNYLHHLIKKTRQKIIIRNFIVLSNSNELTGSIKATYILEIPNNTTVRIKNSLGDLSIKGIVGNYTLDVKYGNILIKESTGNFNITQQIGDLFINDCSLTCGINSKNVSSNFQNIKGSYILKTNMGSLNFELTKNISAFNLNSIGTQINLSNVSCFEYNWDIVSEIGTLYFNECNIKEKTKVIIDNRIKNLKKTKFKYKSDNPNSIKIVNKYSNIFIN